MMSVRLRNLGSLHRLTCAELLHEGQLNKVTLARRHLHKKPSSIFDIKKGKAKALCGHVVQIGDPLLRSVASPVDPESINSVFIKTVVDEMKKLLVKYDAIGLSAPQVGLPLQITVMQVTPQQISFVPEESRKALGMEEVPMRVVINPRLTVTDSNEVSARESCCSVQGMSAIVPRAEAVRVTGLDENGEKVDWEAKRYTARILQHEVDHISGKMFTDFMDRSSLRFDYWDVVNYREGQFKLYFGGEDPPKWWARFLPKHLTGFE